MSHASITNHELRFTFHVSRFTFFALTSLLYVLFLSPTPVYAQSPVEFTEVWLDDAIDHTASVTWGDYDGDGDLDLAVGNFGYPPEVNRLYRNDGGILTEVASALGTATDDTYSVAWGDYDGDGDLDLAVGNYGQVNRLFRNDDGTFTEVVGALGPATDNTHSIAWGDYDDDGDLDLAVGNYGQVNRLYRNDDGMFTAVAGALGTVVDWTYSVAWGDYDGDGDLDLAVGNYSGVNRLYRNDEVIFVEVVGALGTTVDDTLSVAWGDYDSDGDLDLAVGNSGLFDGVNRLYRNDSGMFIEAGDALGAAADYTSSIAWGDYDSDGDLDLAVGNSGLVGGVNRLYRNDGGTLAEVVGALGAVTDNTTSVAWGDYDGDGDLDLAVGNQGQMNRLYRNDVGTFAEVGGALGAATDNTTSVAWGDYDGDGDLDLAVGNIGVNRLYRNDSGMFIEVGDALGAAADYTSSVAWGDYDSDGDLDLAVGNYDQVHRLYRNNDGTFAEVVGALSIVTDKTWSVVWGDYDGDGDLDLAVGNGGFSNTLKINQIYRNDGEVFAEVIGALGMSATQTRSLVWGDYDGDGDLDLAVGNRGQMNRLYRNDGRTFTEVIDALGTVTDNTMSVAWGDVDGDGDLDLAVGNGDYLNAQPNRLYRNDGGTFAEVVGALGTVTERTYGVAWGDYDGDGDLDLAVGNDNQVNRLYRNGRQSRQVLANNTPGIQINGLYTSTANYYAAAQILDSPIIPITYTLFNSTGDSVGQIETFYSPDGGGRWLPAVAASGTVTSNLAPVGGPYKGLAGYWKFDEGYGALALDSSGHAITGTLVNEPVFTTTVPPSITFHNPYALGFDGVDDYVVISNSITLTNTSFTLAAWARRDASGAYHFILAQGPSITITNEGLHFGFRADDRFVCGFWFSDLDTLSTYTDTAWHHWACTYNASTLQRTLYRDGNQVAQNTVSANYQGSGDLRIGAFSNDFAHFQGLIDDVRVYRYALSAVEIQTLAHPAPLPVFKWDTFASGFFGQSDNIVFRIVAHPQPATAAPTGTYKYYNSTSGPFQRPYASATTFPFRVRGTQVRVYSETVHISNTVQNALVYRWNEGIGSSLMADRSGAPFRTDQYGYLQGRGQLGLGDQLLAMLPISTVAEYAGALMFDGVDDTAFIIPLNSTLVTETAVSFWISTTQGTGTPFAYANPLADATFLIANPGNLTLWRGNTYSVTTGVTVTDGMWHHIAITWRSSDGQVRVYKDGADVYTGTLAAGTIISPGGNLVLGGDQNSTSFFHGVLDEVHMWDTVLTDSHILDELYGLLVESDPHLTAAWSFDDPENPGRDQSRNGNNLTLSGTTWEGDYLGGYTVYHTNGVPNTAGITATAVTQPGVQEIAVTAQHPLILFDLNLSLEWDAHNDPVYLQQLEIDLKKASAYLYDFTNGQVALGKVTVYQNADYWASAHIAVQASNRLRPFASIGGLPLDVFTETVTVDGQDHTLTYGPGQIRMGATWNRYGDPTQSIGVDWPLILAHELSHYLLYQYDVYLGLNEDNLLVPADTCTGSAMGDVYALDNTEFISDTVRWTDVCSRTLAAQTLGRTEWDTLRTWYPWLITPTLANDGPSQMSFEFTTVEIVAPTQAQGTLEDPTFYLDYAGGVVSSSDARAFLLRDADDVAQPGPDDFEYIYDLGSPIGGQNRVTARGARPGDRLCVFDSARAQFGCEVIAAGDERLILEEDATWTPVIQISPVNSTTFILQVTNLASDILTLKARVYPEFGSAFANTDLVYVPPLNGYTGTLHLDYPVMLGHVQVWADEGAPPAETNPRREAFVSFGIGGNPGIWRGSGGGIWRGSGGGIWRGSGGGIWRGSGGGSLRAGEAPMASPDGQMILYASDEITFAEGQFYTIQAMAGLPDVPPGRTVVGQGYNLVATEGTPITGSVSIQYMGSDVLAAGAYEDDLELYFWDGLTWTVLFTVRNTYYNMVSAPSQGAGVYALLASVKIPLYRPGWNLFSYPVRATQPVTQALLSISGYYTTVYGYAGDDADDPWKVYDITAPDWVNDLTTLEFPQAYWINVSQAITLYLSSGTMALEPTLLQATLPLPPATFYGVLKASATWTPTAGMSVTAWIEGQRCGQAQTQVVDDRVVYAIDVLATDESGACGIEGKLIIFQMAGQVMAPAVFWDNRHLWELALHSAQYVYLPLVLRN